MRRLMIGAVLAFALSAPANAALNVFACEPEWGALAQEIGGANVTVYTATTGAQYPHHIQARPSLIAKARNADITVCTGAELEIGWLPMVVQQSGNGKIAAGTPGSFEAAGTLVLLEVPDRLDRADGDVHAAGNPHVQTDPRNVLEVAAPLEQRFAMLDPANAQGYAANLAAFSARFSAAIAKWEQEAEPLKGSPIVVQHDNWVYLEHWLGLKRVASIEPKPGVPPSSGYLAQLVETLQKTPARVVIRAAYEEDRPSTFISQKTGIPSVALPFTVGGTDGAKDLISLYDDTIARLVAAAKGM